MSSQFIRLRDWHIAERFEQSDAFHLSLDEWISLLHSLESAGDHDCDFNKGIDTLYRENLPEACRSRVRATISEGDQRMVIEFDPSRPTSYAPGSPAKIEVLRERCRRQLPLHIRGDATS